MTRRESIAIMAGTLIGTFVKPMPRRSINLLDFCGSERMKYDLRLPYVYNDWTFATDSIVCVRVRPIGSDKADHTGDIPPFEKLKFNHDRLRGWQTMTEMNPITAKHSNCPACNGYGRIGHQINWKDCQACGGYGHQMTYAVWHDYGIEKKCKACDGRGFPKTETCKVCCGNAIGTLPGLVCVNGEYFDYGYYERIRKLNAEYVNDYWLGCKSIPALKFKFAEGDGILLGIDSHAAKHRIELTK